MNTLTKQNFAKFFGQAMDYKDFWKVQSEWEVRFEQDYNQYCKNYSKSEKKARENEEPLKERPGLCWELKRDSIVRDLVAWSKRKPEESKS